MNLNIEQREAVATNGSICVRACPGSGKTRTIVAKLFRCIEEVSETPRRVACLTYTHAAVEEIEKRLREYGSTDEEEYAEIGTIHSFCLTNILQPFHYLLPELRAGFEVIPPEADQWHQLVEDLAEKYALDHGRLDSFATVHRRPDHTLFVPPDIPDAAAAQLVAYLDSHGLVSFSDIVYHSTRLVAKASQIARGLACRFAWMLVDEFQDTSEGQVVILRAIAGHSKTRFFLVGDPNQSIMGFAGAHPRLMETFPKEIGAKTEVVLPGNYRCSRKIVSHAERLIQTKPGMRAVGNWKGFGVEPQLFHVEGRTNGIFEYFLPAVDELGISLGESAVLAPWWLPLYQLARDLRERGIPVLGPGARPYRRSRLFASFAEHLCAYTEDKDSDLFRGSQRALFLMLLNLSTDPNWQVFSYEGRRCLCSIAGMAQAARDHYDGQATEWLRLVALQVTSALIENEFLSTDLSHVLPESVEDMIRDMVRNKVDTANLHISDLGLYARPRDCMQLLTMHGSKGREFDAVAIVDLHDGRLPHFARRTQDEYDESRRQLYVGITRARKLLMYFTDSSHTRNRPSPFLAEMGLVSSE